VSERVLVTGATGFVGAGLVTALAHAGKKVRAATRRPEVASFPKRVEVVAVPDFREGVDWKAPLAGVDAVVHLAGIAHVGLKLDAAVYDRVIHVATAEMARACADAGVRRLLFLSSLRAQSGAAATHVLREDDAPEPSEHYGRAKLKAEAAVRACGSTWTILRPAVVYGPGVKGNLAGLMRVAATPWPLPFASFTNLRSLVGLENLIAAVGFALDADAAINQTYLVADPEPVTFADIVAALRRGMGRASRLYPVPPVLIAGALKALSRANVWDRLGGSLVVDSGKLIAAGWSPDRDTLAGLARMAEVTLAARATASCCATYAGKATSSS
jgi:nucleoside-diphosphate-sugar epimerase